MEMSAGFNITNPSGTWRKVKRGKKYKQTEISQPKPGNIEFQVQSWVSVTTTEDVTWYGKVVESPKSSLLPGYITLGKLKTEDGRTMAGQQTFLEKSIRSVCITPGMPQPPDPNEFIFFPDQQRMDTVIIKQLSDLESLVSSLQSVNEVGCHVSGAEGRFDKAEHLLFSVRNVLVVISLANFEGENAKLLWEKLGKCIFGNPNITKIFFDSCHAGDYLYHQHSIRLTNVFDLKVTYEFLKENCQIRASCSCRDDKSGKFCGKITCVEQATLWDCFLPNKVSFIDHLMMKLSSQGMEEMKAKRKRLALQVKYLLQLKEAMLSQLLRPIKIASEYSNQMVAMASDEKFKSLLTDADG